MKIKDLGFGCLGNGITVWNRAVEVNGDYKIVAHIQDCGEISWRYKRVPKDVKIYIEQAAKEHAEGVRS